jgi:hypothetical protein
MSSGATMKKAALFNILVAMAASLYIPVTQSSLGRGQRHRVAEGTEGDVREEEHSHTELDRIVYC